MQLINCTGHALTIRDSYQRRDEDIVLPPSGIVARVSSAQSYVGDIHVQGQTIAIYETLLNTTIEGGLPEPRMGVLYVTSSIVAQAAAAIGRTDVVAPDTGPTAIRVDGQVVAVTRLQRWAKKHECEHEEEADHV